MASKPYLTETGELIIPSDAPVEYRWWNGGQSLKETLKKLNAPEEVVHRVTVHRVQIATEWHTISKGDSRI